MEQLDSIVSAFSSFMWGTPLLILLIGGGLFFFIYSGFIPLRYFGRGVAILAGRYDNDKSVGRISHFQALASSMAATVGMGNISGVALAISTGGPGALFWMWVSAIIGMSTKFFTCTLAVMYRSKDPQGEHVGGPMYVITKGLGPRWRPLASLFAVAGFVGAWPIFTANQLTQLWSDHVIPSSMVTNPITTKLILGVCIALFVGIVIIGGLKRIAYWAERLVPAMVILYVVAVFFVLFNNLEAVLPAIRSIFVDAFTAKSVLGGGLGALVVIGARRAAFSNEAGIGTAPMLHGDARNHEPIHEGLVAMLGPFIDTIIVCSLTAIAIIVSGVWQGSESDGITLTVDAFAHSLPILKGVPVIICASIFALTTLFTHNFYGNKCLTFLTKTDKYSKLYNIFYLGLMVVGAALSMNIVINIIDGFYAMMAIPTMISALLLAPKVMKEWKAYKARANS